MKTMKMTLGWLVMAAALTMGLTACTGDDSLVENMEQPAQPTAAKTVHVTVDAGISDGTTRSAVDYTNGTRTLQFTTGDRLYIRGVLETGKDNMGTDHDTKLVAGYLTVDASSIDASGTSASFTGDLDILEGDIVETEFGQKYVIDKEAEYDWQYMGYDEEMGEEIYDYVLVQDEEGHWETDYDKPLAYGITGYHDGSYNFTDPANPLADCRSVSSVLVHKDAGDRFVVNVDKSWYYKTGLAANAEELMTTYLTVEGTYADNHFTLATSGTNPILNCTISGLTAGTTYDVIYLYGTSSYKDRKMSLSSLTADAQGQATLAFFGNAMANAYHAIRFVNQSDGSDWKLVNIAQKTLGSKVYNVSRTAEDDPDALLQPRITWTSVKNDQPVEPNEYNRYQIWGPWVNDHYEPSEISLSGIFDGYNFSFQFGATIHISNLTGTYDSREFIYSSRNLNIDISGANSITSKNYRQSISVEGTLKFSGNGTLTLTANNGNYCGLWCNNYSAADGYTLTRSDCTDNGDGTYTWTYTVVPAQ